MSAPEEQVDDPPHAVEVDLHVLANGDERRWDRVLTGQATYTIIQPLAFGGGASLLLYAGPSLAAGVAEARRIGAHPGDVDVAIWMHGHSQVVEPARYMDFRQGWNGDWLDPVPEAQEV